jgi:hypothetical protein
MGKRFKNITPEHKAFIDDQKMFFVGTATAESRINLSPKGMDSLRVVDDNTVIWLNLTGSGNETATHLLENDRMTILFCAFEGKPYILRLYGQAAAIQSDHPEWNKYLSLFHPFRGLRQIIVMNVDLVQKSCGYAVPLYDYVDQRDVLTKWTDKKSDEDIKGYWQEKNTISLDGKSTDFEKR